MIDYYNNNIIDRLTVVYIINININTRWGIQGIQAAHFGGFSGELRRHLPSEVPAQLSGSQRCGRYDTFGRETRQMRP